MVADHQLVFSSSNIAVPQLAAIAEPHLAMLGDKAAFEHHRLAEMMMIVALGFSSGSARQRLLGRTRAPAAPLLAVEDRPAELGSAKTREAARHSTSSSNSSNSSNTRHNSSSSRRNSSSTSSSSSSSKRLT